MQFSIKQIERIGLQVDQSQNEHVGVKEAIHFWDKYLESQLNDNYARESHQRNKELKQVEKYKKMLDNAYKVRLRMQFYRLQI